jgi:GxxExxY protein
VKEVSEKADEASYVTIGAAMEVHRRLGPGYREKVYGNALAIEFDHRGIAYNRQVGYPVNYRGQSVGGGRMDFVVEESVVVELKTVSELISDHEAQLLSYLKGAGYELGLLMNFNRETLKEGLKRKVYTKGE